MKDADDHKGWANYQTWRVSTGLFHDTQFNPGTTVDEVKEMAMKEIETTTQDGAARRFAYYFLEDVDWHEILAAHLPK